MKEGWKLQPLAELCEFQRGLTYAKGDEVESSKNVVLRANNVDLTSNRLDFSELKYISDKVSVPASKLVRPGSLLICTASGSKSHLGKVAFIDEDYGYAFGGFMGQLTPSQPLDPKFLFHMMTSEEYKAFIANLSDGANINNLKFDDLGKFRIPVPPLVEQRRIVGVLDEAFAGLAVAQANTEKNLKNARALFESHLQRVIEELWLRSEIVSLSDIASDITDGDHLPPPKSPEGVPFITIGNISKASRQIDFTDTYKVPRPYFEKLKPNRRPKFGDVLYTVTGSFGIPVLVDETREFCFQRHIGLVRPGSKTDSRWLCYLLLSPQVFAQAMATATGAAQRTVSLKSLRRFTVPRVPIGEQIKLASQLDDFIDETQRLVHHYEQKLAALSALKKALLHQAFSGEL